MSGARTETNGADTGIDLALAIEAPELVPFFEACERGLLQLPRCTDCGCYRWPPRAQCHNCAAADYVWVDVPPRGAVYSWTTTHRSPSPGYEDIVPFTIVVVRLDLPGEVRMVGRLVGSGSDGIRSLWPGAPVVPRFERFGASHLNVAWALAD